MPTYPRSVAPSSELQRSLNTLTGNVFSNITAEVLPTDGARPHPLYHMMAVDKKFEQYYYGLSQSYRRAIRSVVGNTPLRHPEDTALLRWLYDYPVTPSFLGGGALQIDSTFERVLTYACQQEREYRQALAQCG